MWEIESEQEVKKSQVDYLEWHAPNQSFWKTGGKGSRIEDRSKVGVTVGKRRVASKIKSFVPVRCQSLQSSYRCNDQSAWVSDSGFRIVVVPSSISVVVSSSNLLVVVSALLIRRLWTSCAPVANFICWKWKTSPTLSFIMESRMVRGWWRWADKLSEELMI